MYVGENEAYLFMTFTTKANLALDDLTLIQLLIQLQLEVCNYFVIYFTLHFSNSMVSNQ